MKLTDAGIRSLKPGTTTYAVYDDELRGFGVRVSAHGAKTFTFLYRLNGRKTRLNLGRFPSVSLAAARTEAHKAIGPVKGERKDPRVARVEAGILKTGGLTVTGLTDFYLASDKFKSGREATRDRVRPDHRGRDQACARATAARFDCPGRPRGLGTGDHRPRRRP